MFTLPPLPYEYDALEPHFDQETMRIHHTKHHQGYTDKLNNALEGTDLEDKSIEYILTHLDEAPSEKKQAIINHGGGYYNHLLFRTSLSPSGGSKPTGSLADAITDTFGSFDSFKEQLTTKALTVFGSGWAWLCKDAENNLILKRTSEQNSPISKGSIPLLGIDVREHAYYLKFQNKRAEYVQAWWEVINRDEIQNRFDN